MNLVCGVMLYWLWTVGQTPIMARLITAMLLVATTFASVIYLRTGNILHHVYTFITMLFLIWPRVIYLIYSQKRTAQDRGALLKRFWTGAIIFCIGYGLWHLDLEKCSELRQIRKAIGLPFAFLFELHGWWHTLTAIGAGQFVKLAREL